MVAILLCGFAWPTETPCGGTVFTACHAGRSFYSERYPGYVTLELAAGAIGLNSSYLSRIFKEETRRTFSEYLNQVRIDAGRKPLESGKYSIKEISNQVGFTTHNYF